MIIFLDIDGVLYTSTYFEYLSVNNIKTTDKYGFLFDPICIRNLNEIITKKKAKIVITSTWRVKGLEFLQNIFKDRGFLGDVIGFTPLGTIENLYFSRSEEIEQYLVDKIVKEDFIIIDDNDLGDDKYNKFLYKTTMSYGLTSDITEKILNEI